MEAKMLLRDPLVFPSEEVLEDTLGNDIYRVLKTFLGVITGDGYGLDLEWKFYNDGKAWLCKVTHGKKTILWLSVWEGFFKLSFHFTEKHKAAVDGLDIAERIKRDFAAAKPSGKLIPMIFDVDSGIILQDILTVVRFKKNLK